MVQVIQEKSFLNNIANMIKILQPYFVDDDPNKIGNTINGIKILSFNELLNLSKEIQIRNIIVAIPSLNKKKINYIQKNFTF